MKSILATRAFAICIAFLAMLTSSAHLASLYAQSTSLHTDRSGYTTGTAGNRTVNTYTDRYGNTTGWIGGKYISTYSDGYGGTTGTVGNKRITNTKMATATPRVLSAEIESISTQTVPAPLQVRSAGGVCTVSLTVFAPPHAIRH